MVCDKTAEPKITPLIINLPLANDEVTIDAYYHDLCLATGQAAGTQIQGIYAVCEPLDNESSPITYTAEDARDLGIFVGYENPWTAYYIPGAHVGWNALVVGVFYYGYSPPPPVRETRKFQGEAGNCSQTQFASPGADLLRGFVNEAASGTVIVDRLAEVIDAKWEREAQDRAILREPVDRDEDWLLYRNLPVDLPYGCVLGLDGQPLRATAISLAAERTRVRRKLGVPQVDLRTPGGSGKIASTDDVPRYYFMGYPQFGVMIHQRGFPHVPPFEVTQLITSTTREAPTSVGVDPTRPIHLLVNSPRAEDWLNEGQIDLCVRVDAR